MRNRAVVGCSVVAGGAFLLVLAGTVFITVLRHGMSLRTVQKDEKLLLVSVDDLAPHTPIPGKRSLCESYVVGHDADGAPQIEYEYDTNKDPDAEEFLLLKSEADISPTIRLAKESFEAYVTGYKMGTHSVSGLEVKECPTLFSAGEDNFAAMVTRDGDIIGNMVVTRKGKIVYGLLLYGVYFDEREPLESVFENAMGRRP